MLGYALSLSKSVCDGNTNKGFLLGNATGRDVRAYEGRLGYWFSARTRVETGYPNTKGGLLYFPGGSAQSDAFATATCAWSRDWSAQLLPSTSDFLPSYLLGAQRNLATACPLSDHLDTAKVAGS